MRRIALRFFSVLLVAAAAPLLSAHAQAYTVTNLVSDGSVPAVTMNSNFQNPWGISVSPTWWINALNTGFSFVVSPATNTSPFKVVIPPATSAFPTGSPAGVVTTSGASGMVLSNGAKASFLFSTLDGAIFGWNGALGQGTSPALVAINNSSTGACYSGLALLNSNATTSYLLAANFAAAKVDVIDQTFHATTLAGSFTDPNLPSGYGPWSIHILNNQVWIAYALRSTTHTCQQVPGPGNGIVDVFDTNGNFVSRVVTGGNLNAPWGVAFAPSSGFGIFSGALLIGNFGDGIINAYDPKNGYAYLGQLMDSTGKPLSYASLWDLLTGGTPVGNSTAVSGGSVTNLYFTAGLANEAHGLFGAIASTTVSGASPTFAFTSSAPAATVTDGSSATATLAIAPVNGFSGTVTFSCTGVPTGAACIFSPSSLTVSSNAPATASITITTMGMTKTGSLARPHLRRGAPTLALASLLPFSLLAFLRRRRDTRALRLFSSLALLMLGLTTAALAIGCGGGGPAQVITPTGSSNVTVTAKSSTGSSQQTTIGLTVQ